MSQEEIDQEEIDKELFEACRAGNRQEVKRLLTQGANVNAKSGGTPLTIASLAGNVEVVRLLLDNGAHIDATNGEGYAAIQYANDAVVELLAFRGASVNAKPNNQYKKIVLNSFESL